MNDTIDTDRLSLRPFEHADAGRLAYFLGDYDIARMTATIPHPYPVISAEGWILMQTAAWARGARHVFAVTTASDGLVGSCGVTPRRTGDVLTAEIGYWIGKPYWGEGYAAEAAGALLAWARDQLRVTIFTAGHYVDNPASGRVLQKLGFERTGSARLFGLARQATKDCERYVWPRGAVIDTVVAHNPHAEANRSLAS